MTGNERKLEHLWKLDGAKERLQLVRADLVEEGSFDEAIKDCKGVFHTASPVLKPSTDPKECPFSILIYYYACHLSYSLNLYIFLIFIHCRQRS